jgi:glycosyltransferase involved in cell wall biosynthesis
VAVSALGGDPAEQRGADAFGRSLAMNAEHNGDAVRRLYGVGLDWRRSDNPLMREAQLADARFGSWEPGVNLVARLARLASALVRTARVEAVPSSGAVLRPSYDPDGDGAPDLWNLPDAQRRADAYFKTTTKLLPVRLPSPVSAMHWTKPVVARAVGVPNLYCVPDLAAFLLPYASPLDKRRLLRRWRAIIGAADHLLVSSEACGRDLVRLFGVPEHRFTVTYQISGDGRPQGRQAGCVTQEQIRATFDLPHRGYYVCHGPVDMMSNIGRLAEAYMASGTKHPLLIVGSMGYKGHLELRTIRDDHVRYFERDASRIVAKRQITVIDGLPRDLLAGLVRGARAVVVPFLYECVGTAALEAMRYGTPVITAATGAMPELVADAALTVDPYDPRQIADAIRAVDGGDELRARLSGKGPRRAAQFGPEAFNGRLEAVYERLGLRPTS